MVQMYNIVLFESQSTEKQLDCNKIPVIFATFKTQKT